MSEWDTKTAEWYAEKYGDYATNMLGVRALNIAGFEIAKEINLEEGDVNCTLWECSQEN